MRSSPVSFVGRYGHILQFAVISTSRPIRHTVEVDADTLLARCSCEHFEHRLMFEQPLGSGCKHMLLVMSSFPNIKELARLTKEENK